MSLMSLYLLHSLYSALSCSSYLYGLWDGWQVTVQLLFCGVLVPGFVKKKHRIFYCSSHVAFFRVQVVKSCCNTKETIAWKISCFILLERLVFHIIDSLTIAVHAFSMYMLMLHSADGILLLRYVNWSTNFRAFLFYVEMASLPNHWRNMYKISWCNTIVCWFLFGIWFYTQRTDGANTINVWSPKRNFYQYNYALQKHRSNGSLNWWWLQLIWYCHRSFAMRYINIISVYNLPRLCSQNISRSNERKWFHMKKKHKGDILLKLWQIQTIEYKF